ncbi:hypothetical protein JKF63_06311 [Porcisia hertigi]|uniref:Calmodulin n=1 Tax=Porcisia hertigi TaxID=2761500 RepID=A0A836IX29_9TRYP|nr:hypothetical protein JKF63_06311 [Porcisia hertigi]
MRRLMTALHLKPTEQELEEVFEESHNAPTGSFSATSLPFLPPSVGPAATQKVTSLGGDRTSSAKGVEATEAVRTVTFPEFAAIMARRVQSEYTAKQLRNAFQLFESPDMPEGFVSTAVLAHALATYVSQKLEAEEIDRLMAAVDPQRTGRVNYYEFVDIVTG